MAVAPPRSFDWGGGTDSGPSNPAIPKFRFLLGFRSFYLENLEKKNLKNLVGSLKKYVPKSRDFPFRLSDWGTRPPRPPGVGAHDEWYTSNQTIHINLIIIFLTLSLRIACTNVESHWGELGQLTHRRHGPTNPEHLSLF